jgi:putative transposase
MEKPQDRSALSDLQEQCPGNVLEALARKGARQLLAQAMEAEVSEFVEKHRAFTDEDGRRLVVRNGHLPERELVTGIGPLKISQPRVDDRALTEEERFSSQILPRYLRRVASVDNLIPLLYLKGVSSGDMSEALTAILGPKAAGLSASNVIRLKGLWEQDYKVWCTRNFEQERYVYFWVDGIHFNVRLDEERSCILVIMGANESGRKELLAISDGYAESKASWREILLDLKRRGLKIGPKLAVGDGALGFWAALREVYPKCRQQRCWVHKTANVLDKMPKSVQGKAKGMLHEMWQAPTKEKALAAYDHFLSSWEEKYPKAVDCLRQDKEELFAFYDFPAAHWVHIRTTNPCKLCVGERSDAGGKRGRETNRLWIRRRLPVGGWIE